MLKKNNFKIFFERVKNRIDQLPGEVGQLAVNHSLEAFRNEGLAGEEKWTPRKNNGAGSRSTRRGLLVKTGRLRRSIRVLKKTRFSVTVGTNVPYAAIHNEGGITHPTVTNRMRRFAWAQYKKTGKDFWKNLAMTQKRSLTVEIPARPFLKITPVLQKEVKDFIRDKIRGLLK